MYLQPQVTLGGKTTGGRGSRPWQELQLAFDFLGDFIQVFEKQVSFTGSTGLRNLPYKKTCTMERTK